MSAAGEQALEAPTEDAPRTQVVYVMGAGRSGSSILGVALGNCDGFFFAGELDKWLPKAGKPTYADEHGERFWTRVREQLPDEALPLDARSGAIDRSSALFRPRALIARRRLRGPYARFNEALFHTIASATGAGCIVDTSHYPLRARELQSLPSIDLSLIFLARDPQAVVVSLSRRDVVERSFGTLTTNAYLLLTHALSIWVFRKHPRERRLFVRYEDLRADPARVLRQILDLTGSRAGTPDLSALRTGQPLHGNRLVNAPSVAFEGGDQQASARSRLTTALQAPAQAVLSRLRPSSAAR